MSPGHPARIGRVQNSQQIDAAARTLSGPETASRNSAAQPVGDAMPQDAILQETKSIIFSAATDAFIEGEGRLKMTDVAKRAGISVALLYKLFDNETELVAEILSEFYERYRVQVHEHVQRSALAWRCEEVSRLRRTVEFLLTERLAPTVMRCALRNDKIAETEDLRLRTDIEATAENIRRGQLTGDIDQEISPELAASMIHGGLRRVIHMTLLDDETPWVLLRENRERLLREVGALTEHMLGLEEGAGSENHVRLQ